MSKIAKFAYQWEENSDDYQRKFIKKPDGLKADSTYSLSDVLIEAQSSNIISRVESEMLRHIIPCCRQDRGKRDFIESLLSSEGINENIIQQIDRDIKFDEEKAPAMAAK